MRAKGLFVGFGAIASNVCHRFSGQIEAHVLRQSPMAIYEPITQCFNGDVADASTLRSIDRDYDFVLYCVSPTTYTEEGYRRVFLNGVRNLLASLSTHTKQPRIFFVSSTSVYAQADGERVDEASEALGASATSRVLRQTEVLLEQSDCAATVVRFSGIYGGARTRLIRQVLNREPVLSDQVRISNRIHEEDAVGFIKHVIDRFLNGESVHQLYTATDGASTDLNDVYRFLGDLTGKSLVESLIAQPSRRSGNKTILNERMLATGYALKYPSYREGYTEMWERFESGALSV